MANNLEALIYNLNSCYKSQEMYTAMDSLLKEQSFFGCTKHLKLSFLVIKLYSICLHTLLAVVEECRKLLPWSNHTKVILTE